MVFEITILGSSSALPTSQRYPSAHVLNSHERFFLVDCGEGTQMQLRRNRIRIGKIHNIFITHTHGDHIFGLYGLLSTLNLIGRLVTLTIYAPEDFEQVLLSHLSDFDIHLNYELIFVPLKGSADKVIYQDKYTTVTAIPLKHRVPTYGFLFSEKLRERNVKKEMIKEYKLSLKQIVALKRGEDIILSTGHTIPNKNLTNDPPSPRSYAYISDTEYLKKLALSIKGVTLLYHEATFGNEHKDLAKITGHSTAEQAAMIARDAEAEKLLIGHFSARYKDISPLLLEAQEIFPNTEAAEDNNRIAL